MMLGILISQRIDKDDLKFFIENIALLSKSDLDESKQKISLVSVQSFDDINEKFQLPELNLEKITIC